MPQAPIYEKNKKIFGPFGSESLIMIMVYYFTAK